MDEALVGRIREIWNAQARLHAWGQGEADARIVDEVTGRLNAAEPVSDRAIVVAVQRTHFRWLYQGLIDNQRAAAEELLHACTSMVRGKGLSPEQVEEVAQETISRLIANLPKLDDPESVFAYARMILYRLSRDLLEEPAADSLDQQSEERTNAEPLDPQHIEELVESKVLNAGLRELLGRKLKRPIELVVFIRTVLHGEKPRDVAYDLNTPAAFVRVIKNRAIQALREDAEFMGFINSLREDNQNSTI